jgi:1-acyl-sn-glycerol-3-phosphate acyltransferase
VNAEKLRSGLRAAGMATLTIGMLGGVELHQRLSRERDKQPVFQSWMKLWAARLLDLFGTEITLAGRLPPPAAGARLIVANHRSPLDILLMLRYFGGVVLSRADLAEWPVIGLAARRAETIFVDRADKVSGVLAVRALRDRLERGRTVIVFPEGTTVAGDSVLPFQEGAFAAVRGLEAEIVPVGIAYPPGSEFTEDSFLEHVTRVAQRPLTRIACVVGMPRPARGTRKQLAAELHDEVQQLVHQARRALPD